MNKATATLKNYRQSPRKVRLVADLVRGKKAEDAINLLSFTPKRSALPIQKLISSAIANAKSLSLEAENLIVKEIRVDSGPTLFRRRPRSRGMANPIKKRTSQVIVSLVEAAPKKAKKASKKKAETSEK